MIRIVHGVVRGKTIELDENLGVAEGQKVEVQVKLVTPAKAWGEGLQRCAGSLADEWTEEDDRILTEIHENRRRDTRRDVSQ